MCHPLNKQFSLSIWLFPSPPPPSTSSACCLKSNIGISNQWWPLRMPLPHLTSFPLYAQMKGYLNINSLTYIEKNRQKKNEEWNIENMIAKVLNHQGECPILIFFRVINIIVSLKYLMYVIWLPSTIAAIGLFLSKRDSNSSKMILL